MLENQIYRYDQQFLSVTWLSECIEPLKKMLYSELLENFITFVNSIISRNKGMLALNFKPDSDL